MTSLLWLLTDAPGPAPWVRWRRDSTQAVAMVALCAGSWLAVWGAW